MNIGPSMKILLYRHFREYLAVLSKYAVRSCTAVRPLLTAALSSYRHRRLRCDRNGNDLWLKLLLTSAIRNLKILSALRFRCFIEIGVQTFAERSVSSLHLVCKEAKSQIGDSKNTRVCSALSTSAKISLGPMAYLNSVASRVVEPQFAEGDSDI